MVLRRYCIGCLLLWSIFMIVQSVAAQDDLAYSGYILREVASGVQIVQVQSRERTVLRTLPDLTLDRSLLGSTRVIPTLDAIVFTNTRFNLAFVSLDGAEAATLHIYHVLDDSLSERRFTVGERTDLVRLQWNPSYSHLLVDVVAGIDLVYSLADEAFTPLQSVPGGFDANYVWINAISLAFSDDEGIHLIALPDATSQLVIELNDVIEGTSVERICDMVWSDDIERLYYIVRDCSAVLNPTLPTDVLLFSIDVDGEVRQELSLQSIYSQDARFTAVKLISTRSQGVTVLSEYVREIPIPYISNGGIFRPEVGWSLLYINRDSRWLNIWQSTDTPTS